jgi:hypothetical protein
MKTVKWQIAALSLGVLLSSRARAQGDDTYWESAPSPESEADRRDPPARAPAIPHAPDAPAPPFGEQGEWAIDSASSLSLFSTQYSNSDASTTTFSFGPSVSYFVARNVSLGLDVEVHYSDGKGYLADYSLTETKTTTFAVGPQLGFNIPLGQWVSIFPRLTVGLETVRQTTTRIAPGPALGLDGTPVLPSPLAQPVGPRIDPWLTLFAPLLIHPTSHFFLGIGPTFHRTFGPPGEGADSGLGERTTVGFSGLLGGTWGGPSAASPRDSTALVDPSKPQPRRFGEKGDFAVMGGVNIGGSWASFDGTGSSSSTVGISPSFDYFVADHFSLGLELDISSATGHEAAGTSYSSQSYGGSGRIGFDIPIATGASLFVVGNVGAGHDTYTHDDSSGNSDAYAEDYVYVGLFAPLLFHLTPHYFVGAGPSISHDVTRAPEGSTNNNLSTRIGVSFVVGGWL